MDIKDHYKVYITNYGVNEPPIDKQKRKRKQINYMIDKVNELLNKIVDDEDQDILIDCNRLLTKAHGLLDTNEGRIYVVIKSDTYVETDTYVRKAYNNIIAVLSKYINKDYGGKKQTRTIKKSKKQQKKGRKSRAKK